MKGTPQPVDSRHSGAREPGAGVAVLFDRVRQDLAYAARGLVRNPGFAATALLTLALGVGASSAMFSVVNTVLLRPLPYSESDRLVAVSTVSHRAGGQLAPTGFADIESWRGSSRTLSAIAAYDGTSVVLEDRDQPARRITAVNQTANMFDVLGVAPAMGRTFTREESAQREAVAVASHEFAQPHFGSAEAALGATVIVNGRPFRIIGVMPPGFRSHDNGAHLFVPETLLPDWDRNRLNRGPAGWRVIARLAPGVTLDDARTELAGIAAGLARDFPATNAESGVVLTPLALQVTGTQLRLALFTLVGAVGAVLLIACSNFAGLLLARGAVRQREFAVRTALGASRSRIVGQLVLESVVLAIFAALVGTGIAAVALKGIRTLGPANIPRLDEITLDGSALVFAVCLSFVSAVASSLAPALRSTARNPMSMLRSGRGLSDTPTARRIRSALVSAVLHLPSFCSRRLRCSGAVLCGSRRSTPASTRSECLWLA